MIDYFGFDEAEFLRETKGTIKFGIRHILTVDPVGRVPVGVAGAHIIRVQKDRAKEPALGLLRLCRQDQTQGQCRRAGQQGPRQGTVVLGKQDSHFQRIPGGHAWSDSPARAAVSRRGACAIGAGARQVARECLQAACEWCRRCQSG